jgi:hypothetical protein
LKEEIVKGGIYMERVSEREMDSRKRGNHSTRRCNIRREG